MKKSAHSKGGNRFPLKRAMLVLLCLLILICIIWIVRQPTEKAEAGPAAAEKAAEEVIPTAEPTPEPTAEPTAEPTPEPTPEPTAEPTAEPTPEPTAEPTAEPTPEPTASVTPVPVEPGTYTYTFAGGEWTLSLRDNGTFTLTDPDGGFHTGEGWTQNDDGTVSCGPTDIYQAPFAFSGGCSKWKITGQHCEPVIVG